MANKNEKILVSTDIGSDIDDALSLLVMFNSRINLKGIYTTNAKDLRFRSYIAKHMVNVVGREITVAQGENNSLHNIVEPYYFFEDCFVDESFEDVEASKVEVDIQFKKLEEAGIISNGLEDLANKLEKERYAIFSLAPLTDIARIIQNYSNSIKNIERLYVMGGSLEGNVEHNVRHDTTAADTVFNSNIPITIIPRETCLKYRMPVSRLEQLKNSKIGNYVRGMAKGFIAAKTALNFRDMISVIQTKRGTNKIKSGLLELMKEYDDKELEANINKPSHATTLNFINDPYCGAFETEEYFNRYNNLIKWIKNQKLNHLNVENLANSLEKNIPKDISVADVYVPYCFLHPEKLTIKRGQLTPSNFFGSSKFTEGNKHDFVVDLDYNHFEEFLNGYLY